MNHHSTLIFLLLSFSGPPWSASLVDDANAQQVGYDDKRPRDILVLTQPSWLTITQWLIQYFSMEPHWLHRERIMLTKMYV